MPRKITYDPDADYYTILGLHERATPEEIRQAYRRCVREYHPDVNPDRAEWATDQIQRVNEAYGVLRQPTLRREYDRLRWPHVPHPPRDPGGDGAATGTSAADPAYRSPFDATYFDPERPWWDQVTTRAPGHYAFGGSRAGRAAPLEPEEPAWLAVAAWLRNHRLGWLEPIWLTLVGLWRSPYSGVLTLLGLVLAVNVAVIVYAFIAVRGDFAFDFDTMLPDWVAQRTPAATAPPSSAAGLAADQLYLGCSDDRIQIRQPVSGSTVADTFHVYGTVQHPNLWHYTLEIGYLGTAVPTNSVPASWRTVRAPPQNQSIPEPPVVDDLLTEALRPVNLRRTEPGYYAVRLRVLLKTGVAPPPCDVVVHHE